VCEVRNVLQEWIGRRKTKAVLEKKASLIWLVFRKMTSAIYGVEDEREESRGSASSKCSM
jgi:hypothetical protein